MLLHRRKLGCVWLRLWSFSVPARLIHYGHLVSATLLKLQKRWVAEDLAEMLPPVTFVLVRRCHRRFNTACGSFFRKNILCVARCGACFVLFIFSTWADSCFLTFLHVILRKRLTVVPKIYRKNVHIVGNQFVYSSISVWSFLEGWETLR